MYKQELLISALCFLTNFEPDCFELNGEGFENIVWKTEKYKKPTKTAINNKIKELEAKAELEAKNQDIENHIYSKYPTKGQQQDNVWVQNFTTKLVAMGVTDLEKKVVDLTTSFYKGKTLDEVLANIDDAVKPMYEKLVKVAVKNEWAYNCILAGKKAIKDDTDAEYPVFPKFD